MRVLDVGCGPGALSVELAGRVGEHNVAAIDPAPRFVAACRSRIPGADVREGVAESLPWDGGSFDAALCSLVVAWMTDADQGIGEMVRVTKPGGTVAAAMWDLHGDGLPMLSYFWRAASEIDPSIADEQPRAGVRDGDLVERFVRAGLQGVTGGTLETSVDYAGFDDYWEPFTGGGGPPPAPSTPRSTMPARRRCATACAARCPRARSRCRRAPGWRSEPFPASAATPGAGIANRYRPASVGESPKITDPLAALEQARRQFDEAEDFTVAVEEEFAILDAETLDMVPGFERLAEACAGHPDLEGMIAGELIRSEIEVKTGKCESFADAAEAMARRRVALVEVAGRLGFRLSAAGTHPFARWQDQQVIDTPHYHLVESTLRYVAWRNNTFGLHVHVGGARRRPCDGRAPGAADGAARAAGGLGQLALGR